MLQEEKNEAINQLVKSAVIDSDVKGGLRWPLGKDSVADRFSIAGFWHTKYKAFKSQTAKIKLRHADRFDHRNSTGEVSSEVFLKLTGISKHLRVSWLLIRSLLKIIRYCIYFRFYILISYVLNLNMFLLA